MPPGLLAIAAEGELTAENEPIGPQIHHLRLRELDQGAHLLDTAAGEKRGSGPARGVQQVLEIRFAGRAAVPAVGERDDPVPSAMREIGADVAGEGLQARLIRRLLITRLAGGVDVVELGIGIGGPPVARAAIGRTRFPKASQAPAQAGDRWKL